MVDTERVECRPMRSILLDSIELRQKIEFVNLFLPLHRDELLLEGVVVAGCWLFYSSRDFHKIHSQITEQNRKLS